MDERCGPRLPRRIVVYPTRTWSRRTNGHGPRRDGVAPNRMTTIRAAVMTAPRAPIGIRELPVPNLPLGSALLRTRLSEMSGTDVHLRHGRYGPAARGESPAAFDCRCIPPWAALGVVHDGSNTSGILPPRALPWATAALVQRGLGATRGSPRAAESTALLGISHYRLRTCGAPQLRRCSDVIALPRRSRGSIASPDFHHGLEGHVSGRSCGTGTVPKR